MKLVKEVSTVPVLANGDVFTMQDANDIVAATGVDGTFFSTHRVSYVTLRIKFRSHTRRKYENNKLFTNYFSLSLALLDHRQQIGTMSARGILENPALYAGHTVTPWECIEDYVDLALSYGTNAFIFHHHLMYMFEKSMSNAGTILLFSSDQLMCTFRFLLRALPPPPFFFLI